jgi:hypothetical protein
MIPGISEFADERKGTPGIERWRAYACDIAAAYMIWLLWSRPVPLYW